MKLSEHFDLSEFTRSKKADDLHIDNTPSELQTENLRQLCLNVLEPLRSRIELPISIDSGFRSAELNKAVGGVPNSQHAEGKACDIVAKGISVDELFEIASKFVPYDQIINEDDGENHWVHISYSNPLRREKLWMRKILGKNTYFRTNPDLEVS